MGSRVRVVVSLIALLGGVAIVLAGAGSVEAGLAVTMPYAAALQLMAMAPSTTTASTMGFEAARRRVLSNIRSSSLDPNRAACLSSCPAAGGAYTGRGCQKVYQCSAG